MRITVNLATRPYVQLRPFFLRLRILMAVLAVVGVGLAFAIHSNQQKLDRAEAQMDRLRAQTLAFQQEKAQNERRMRLPENASVLDRAHFLNALFLRKSFSWTAVMMDLETVLPSGVQVTSIEPQISGDGDVMIRMRVSGERDRAVQLVRNLERSRRFLAPRLTGEASQAKEANAQGQMAAPNGAPAGVEFEVLADYNPLPEGEPYPKAKHAELEGEGAGLDHGPRRHTTPSGAASSKYPRDGVVLKPYAPGRPNALQQGGPR